MPKDEEKRPQVTFSDLLNQRKWEDYKAFISEASSVYISELEGDLKREAVLKKKLRAEVLAKNFIVRRFEPLLKEAEKLLFCGQVVGKRRKSAASVLSGNGHFRFSPLRTKNRATATLERAERAMLAVGQDKTFLLVY